MQGYPKAGRLVLWRLLVIVSLGMMSAIPIRAADKPAGAKDSGAAPTLTVKEAEGRFAAGEAKFKNGEYKTASIVLKDLLDSGVNLGAVRQARLQALYNQSLTGVYAQKAIDLAGNNKTKTQAAGYMELVKDTTFMSPSMKKKVAEARKTLQNVTPVKPTGVATPFAASAAPAVDPNAQKRLMARSLILSGNRLVGRGKLQDLENALTLYREAEKSKSVLAPSDQEDLAIRLKAVAGMVANEKFDNAAAMVRQGQKEEGLVELKLLAPDKQNLTRERAASLDKYLATLPKEIAVAAKPAAVAAKPAAVAAKPAAVAAKPAAVAAKPAAVAAKPAAVAAKPAAVAAKPAAVAAKPAAVAAKPAAVAAKPVVSPEQQKAEAQLALVRKLLNDMNFVGAEAEIKKGAPLAKHLNAKDKERWDTYSTVVAATLSDLRKRLSDAQAAYKAQKLDEAKAEIKRIKDSGVSLGAQDADVTKLDAAIKTAEAKQAEAARQKAAAEKQQAAAMAAKKAAEDEKKAAEAARIKAVEDAKKKAETEKAMAARKKAEAHLAAVRDALNKQDYIGAEAQLKQGAPMAKDLAPKEKERWDSYAAVTTATLAELRGELAKAQSAYKAGKFDEAKANIEKIKKSQISLGAAPDAEVTNLEKAVQTAEQKQAELARKKAEDEKRQAAEQARRKAEEDKRKAELERKKQEEAQKVAEREKMLAAKKKADAQALMNNVYEYYGGKNKDWAAAEKLFPRLDRVQNLLSAEDQKLYGTIKTNVTTKLNAARDLVHKAEKDYQSKNYVAADKEFNAYLNLPERLGAEQDKMARERLATIRQRELEVELAEAERVKRELDRRQADVRKLEEQARKRQEKVKDIKATLAKADDAYARKDYIGSNDLMQKGLTESRSLQPIQDENLKIMIAYAESRMKTIGPRIAEQREAEKTKANDFGSIQRLTGAAEGLAKSLRIDEANAKLDEAAKLAAKYPDTPAPLVSNIAKTRKLVDERKKVQTQKVAELQQKLALVEIELGDKQLGPADKRLNEVMAEAAIMPSATLARAKNDADRITKARQVERDLPGLLGRARQLASEKHYEDAVGILTNVLESDAPLGQRGEEIVRLKAELELKAAPMVRERHEVSRRYGALLDVAANFMKAGQYREAEDRLQEFAKARGRVTGDLVKRADDMRKELKPKLQERDAAMAGTRNDLKTALGALKAGDKQKALGLLVAARAKIQKDSLPVELNVRAAMDEQIASLAGDLVPQQFRAKYAKVKSVMATVNKQADADLAVAKAKYLSEKGSPAAAVRALDGASTPEARELKSSLAGMARAVDQKRLLMVADENKQLLGYYQKYGELVKAGDTAKVQAMRQEIDMLKSRIDLILARDMLRKGDLEGAIQGIQGIKMIRPQYESELKDVTAQLGEYRTTAPRLEAALKAIRDLDVAGAQAQINPLRANAELGVGNLVLASVQDRIKKLQNLRDEYQLTALGEAKKLNEYGAEAALRKLAEDGALTKYTQGKVLGYANALADQDKARSAGLERERQVARAEIDVRDACKAYLAGTPEKAVEGLMGIDSSLLSPAWQFEMTKVRENAVEETKEAQRVSDAKNIQEFRKNVYLAEKAFNDKDYVTCRHFLDLSKAAAAAVPEDLEKRYVTLSVDYYKVERQAQRLLADALRAMQANDRQKVAQLYQQLKADYSQTATYQENR